MSPRIALVFGAIGLVAALALAAVGAADTTPTARGLFVATVVVELLALVGAFQARRSHEPGDAGRVTWTLIAAFLTVRVVAELRLMTLYFDWVPGFIATSADLLFVYQSILRYLYTFSDVLFVAAIVTTLRAYRRVGLNFAAHISDYVLIGTLTCVPVTTFILRENLQLSNIGGDLTIVTYRLVAITVGTIIAALCIIVLRYVRQMGGGMLARIWGAVVAAGITRALSFLTLALVSATSTGVAELVEQSLLWAFACAWWYATLTHRSMVGDPKAR